MVALNAKLSAALGDRTAKALNTAFGYSTVEDLLHHYPRRFVARGELTDIDELKDGDVVTILAEIVDTNNRPMRGRKGSILEVKVSDGKKKLSLTFFNQAWREREMRVGRTGLFAGKIGTYKGARQLAHPEYLLIPEGTDTDEAAGEFAGKLIPVYPATAKFPSWKIGQCVRTILDVIDEVPETLPEEYRGELPSAHQALCDIHLPDSHLAAAKALERLTFDEALSLQLLLARRRHQFESLHTTPRLFRSGGLLEIFDQNLPFELTAGQIAVGAEIESDMKSQRPMHRLLQGEVGSGKTIVALRALLAVVDTGGQGALLAPTEVLAAQHFRSISATLGELATAGMLGGSDRATRVVLLTGSTPAAARKEVLAQIEDGSAGIVIGTHALLSEGVNFADLGLIVVDEQHRFGVEQRDALKLKAQLPPHLLVMTATPIPRTVAMTVFGDLDISTLTELPKGRSPITTHVINELEKPRYVERAWERIVEEVRKGAQGYVVAPRIESGKEKSSTSNSEIEHEAHSVESLYEQLAHGPLKSVRVSVLHGKLLSEEKDRIMRSFSQGDIDCLVATTVIEVGVDVPNATVMVIADADRFGISQLHQLRGRVGRGSKPGLCLLLTKVEEQSSAMERLQAVANSLDGFELARVDLDQRREGDVLGTAQSGSRSQLRLLRVLRDEKIIERARDVANEIIAADPELKRHVALRDELAKLERDERSDFIEKA
jgi:ATP-dependent DNA helicase RecG